MEVIIKEEDILRLSNDYSLGEFVRAIYYQQINIMKIKTDYQVNGTDLDLFISGEVIGKSREEHDLFLYDIIAKVGKTEVFRYDGEEHGLLKETELSEEIMLIAEALLVEEKFSKYEQV